ncbi:MAG: hypothetical protein HMLKMBBP_01727 [Planctomycetes bacterium]|nr:hypothetical protein [Planctomycetota bacterium]
MRVRPATLAALTVAAALCTPGCLPSEDDFNFFQTTAPDELSDVNDGMFFVTQRISELLGKETLTPAEKKELRKLRKAQKKTEAVFAAARAKQRAKAFSGFLLLVIASQSPAAELIGLPQDGIDMMKKGAAAALAALAQESDEVRDEFEKERAKAQALLDRAAAADASDDDKQAIKDYAASLAFAAAFGSFACD